jgi:cytochrome c oxidase subunit 3
MPIDLTAGPAGAVGAVRRDPRAPMIPHGFLGMLIFVIAEAMLFAGLISAFTIIKSGAPTWPPAGQPRLPLLTTAGNTAVLLASGVMIVLAHRAFHQGDRRSMRRPLFAALGLGTFFVALQGYEWVGLIREGLTLTSSSLGGFFYLIVGMHALHAVGALALLARACLRLQRGWLTESLFGAAEVFWLFVVGVWPVLYAVVYW